MEYTRSVGDCYESFEGTPQEIAELIVVLDSEEREVKVKAPKISLPNLSKSGLKPNKFAKGGVLKGGEK